MIFNALASSGGLYISRARADIMDIEKILYNLPL